MISAPKKSLVIGLLVCWIVGLFLIYPENARASGSCTANVSPSSVQTATDTNFSFSITNTGSGTITSVKITRPSDNFTLENYSVPGWDVNANSIFVGLTGGTVNAGDTVNLSYHGTSGANEAPSANWLVETNDGTGYVGCSGTLGVEISGVRDTRAPEISDPTVSGITNTTATISWTTDEASTTNVDYGLTEDLGLTKSDSSMVTSHSITLTGLSANTYYSFDIYSTDASGNTARNPQNDLTTASVTSAGSATVSTTTTTTTSTTVVARVVADTTSPSASITTKFDKPFEVPPEITGKATDASRIVKVEYSTDGGKNWLPADADNLGEKSTNYSVIPNVYEDGNYKIVVRATDGVGNKGLSKAYTLVIDRLPPLVGGNIWSVGPIALLPDASGVITTMSGIDNRITMSAVGGPITIDLLVGTESYSLTKSVDSGLWSGVVNFKAPGFYTIKVRSIDGAGNNTLRDLNSVLVIDSGVVTDAVSGSPVLGAKVNVYQKDASSGVWSLWDAQSFGQSQSQLTDDAGRYSYFLPAGTYYITISATSYRKLTSKIFKVETSTALNSNFEMKKGFQFRFFESTNISLNKPKTSVNEQNIYSLVGVESPGITLPSISGKELDLVSLRGKSQVVIFINTWLPATAEQMVQIKFLEQKYQDRISLVVAEEGLSKVSIFAKRGGYDNLTIATDPDGTLIVPYKINTLPTGYFIDRRGVIQKVVTGTISAEDLVSFFESI